jgi:iron complex transport system substrate-binding protein
MRIVSLLPSATEIVYLLRLGNQLTGVSHECDYPPDALRKPKIVKAALGSHRMSSREIDDAVLALRTQGEGVYQIDLEALRAADPSLILTQEICDVCATPYAQVQEAVTKLPRKPEILSLNPQRLDDVLQDIQRVGDATGRVKEAEAVRRLLQERIQGVTERARLAKVRPKVFCLEWLDPIMASGHWVPEMVALAGGIDALGECGAPSRRIAWDRVLAFAPEVLVLMPCGFDIERTLQEVHLLTALPGWEGLPAVQKGQVFAVNGHAYYNRSGPRLVDGLEILAHMIHPELFPAGVPEGAMRIVPC